MLALMNFHRNRIILCAYCLCTFQDDIDAEQEIKEAYKRYTDLKREKSQKVKKGLQRHVQCRVATRPE